MTQKGSEDEQKDKQEDEDRPSISEIAERIMDENRDLLKRLADS